MPVKKTKSTKSLKHSGSAPNEAQFKVVFKKSANLVSRPGGDQEVIVISTEDLDHFYKIDSWAAEIWNLIDGKKSLSEIQKKIVNKSQLKEKLVIRETRKVISQLLKNELIEKSK